MAPMRWRTRLSVGLSELDADHRVLIDVINRLDANVGSKGSVAVSRQALVALTRYAQFHFSREEKVLATCRYTELDDHRAEHRAFIDKMAFIDKIQNVTARLDAACTAPAGTAANGVDRDLLDYLKRWLTHHILIVDMAYRPVVEDNPAAREAAKSFSPLDVWWT